jgi:hypothetical protein
MLGKGLENFTAAIGLYFGYDNISEAAQDGSDDSGNGRRVDCGRIRKKAGTMLVFILGKLWVLGILVWVLIAYILYALFTDRPDSN